MTVKTGTVIEGPFGTSKTLLPERTYSYLKARSISRAHADQVDVEHTANGFRIHFHDPDGNRNGYFLDRDLRPGAENKFVAPSGQPPRVYFPELLNSQTWEQVCNDPTVPLIVTEGPVKGIALAQRGLPAICISGVHSWHKKGSNKLLPEFDLLNHRDREVILLFDHDVLSNVMAQSGLKRFGKREQERHARVYVAEVPNLGDGKTGVDDLLAEKGIKAVRKILAAKKPLNHEDYRHWGLPTDPHPTDTGRALLFRDLYRNQLRYNKAQGIWLIRKRHIWVPDQDDRVYGFVRDLIDLILADSADELDKDSQKNKYRNALALENFNKKESMLREAGTLAEFRLPGNLIDADSHLLGLRNGVLDVRRGQLLEELPPDTYITKTGRVSFEADAECPKWTRFLDEIFGGDRELISFIRKMVGYILTGDTSEQCLFIFHGYGANGKSTFTGVLKELVGDYCRTVDVESLMAKRYGNASGPKEDIARLAGARLVLASETDESKPLAESLIKQMTGGELLTARELYKSSFEFKPQFKIVLVANHIPIIKGTDHAIWRRIRLVPFNVTIPAHKQNPKLVESLLTELPGILNWAIQGHRQWQQRGLTPPKVVVNATAEYRSDMDTVGRFLSDCAELGDHYETNSRQELYLAFEEWCRDEGIRQPMQHAVLGKKLIERGIRKGKSNGLRHYKGVKLSTVGETKAAANLARKAKFKGVR